MGLEIGVLGNDRSFVIKVNENWLFFVELWVGDENLDFLGDKQIFISDVK